MFVRMQCSCRWVYYFVLFEYNYIYCFTLKHAVFLLTNVLYVALCSAYNIHCLLPLFLLVPPPARWCSWCVQPLSCEWVVLHWRPPPSGLWRWGHVRPWLCFSQAGPKVQGVCMCSRQWQFAVVQFLSIGHSQVACVVCLSQSLWQVCVRDI